MQDSIGDILFYSFPTSSTSFCRDQDFKKEIHHLSKLSDFDLKFYLSHWARAHGCNKVCFWGCLVSPAFDRKFNFLSSDSRQELSLNEFIDADLKDLKISHDHLFVNSTVLPVEDFQYQVSLDLPPFILKSGGESVLWILTSLSCSDSVRYSALEILKCAQTNFEECLNRLDRFASEKMHSHRAPTRPFFEIILSMDQVGVDKLSAFCSNLQTQITSVLRKICQADSSNKFFYSFHSKSEEANASSLHLKSSDALSISVIYEFLIAYISTIEMQFRNSDSKDSSLYQSGISILDRLQTRIIMHAEGYLSVEPKTKIPLHFLSGSSAFFVFVKAQFLRLLKASGWLLNSKSISSWNSESLTIFHVIENEFLQWLEKPLKPANPEKKRKGTDPFVLIDRGRLCFSLWSSRTTAAVFLALILHGWSEALHLWMDEYGSREIEVKDWAASVEVFTKKYVQDFGINSVNDLLSFRNISEIVAVFENLSATSASSDLFLFNIYPVYRNALIDAHAIFYREMLESVLAEMDQGKREVNTQSSKEKWQLSQKIKKFLEESKEFKGEAFVFAFLKLMPKIWARFQMLEEKI